MNFNHSLSILFIEKFNDFFLLGIHDKTCILYKGTRAKMFYTLQYC